MTSFFNNGLLIIALIVSGGAAALADEADDILDVPGANPDFTALYIEEIATGNVLCDMNGDVMMLPASTTKVLTTAAATMALSHDSRWSTTAELSGVQADTLFAGTLVIKTSGDPTLGSSKFSNADICHEIADAVSGLGIRHIEGDVVIDESMRIDNTIPEGWQNNDLTSNYGAPYHTTNYSDNIFNLSYPSLSTSPLVPDLTTTTTRSRKSVSVTKSPESNSFTIAAPTKRRKTWSGTFPNSNPAPTLRAAVIKALDKLGITVSGERPRSDSAMPSQLLITHYSPTLGEVMRSLMVRSDNMLAESVLRMLAPGETRRQAISNEFDLFARLNVRPDPESMVTIADGSGLSRNNRINAYFMADVLLAMATSDVCVPFVGLFPKAGVEGTVRNLLADTRLEGRVALKSGSLNRVQCYAGYLLDNEGLPTHIIVFMANDFDGSRQQLRKALTKVLLSLLPG